MLVALRALRRCPAWSTREAARSAIAKSSRPRGSRGGQSTAAVRRPIESRRGTAVREAVRRHRALSIEYYSASHDTLSQRIVDPIRIVFVGDQSYLEAWCRSADGVRLFRFDRIDRGRGARRAVGAPAPALEAGPDTSLFDADPSLPSATLHIAPSATWMFDYYPMRMLRELSDGSCEAEMTYASEDWMARLVLGFGSAVKVVEPDSLAERVQHSAAAALRAYAGAAAAVTSN